MAALLQVHDLRVAYGGIQAVKGVDFEVHEGELVSLIGSNGAGKTTTMKAITGSLLPSAGRIDYLGRDIRGQGPWDLVKQGLVMVPEGRGVFTRMSITENLQMARICGLTKQVFKPTWTVCLPCFPASKNAVLNWRARCLAVNNKCWPWGALCSVGPNCCCWMNHPWVCLR